MCWRQRLTSPKERPAIDAMIERDFIHHRIALMFGSHGEEALTKSRGIDYSLDIQRTKHQLVMPIFKANNGYIAESCLVFFNTVEDAFLAAIQLRAAVHKYNRNHVRGAPVYLGRVVCRRCSDRACRACTARRRDPCGLHWASHGPRVAGTRH